MFMMKMTYLFKKHTHRYHNDIVILNLFGHNKRVMKI